MVGDYKRGQVEWALWQALRRYRGRAPTDPPPVFRTRIKRLLEIDSAARLDSKGRSLGYAFYEQLPTGTGSEAAFTHFNAFCLALAVDLLDAGFKQGEVVFVLRHLKEHLKGEFAKVLKTSPAPRMLIPARDQPDSPTFRLRNRRYADCRVFMLIEKVELSETFGLPRRSGPRQPVAMQPKFLHGIDALRDELCEMPNYYRKILVIEIAETIVQIGRALEKAPAFRRGRRAEEGIEDLT